MLVNVKSGSMDTSTTQSSSSNACQNGLEAISSGTSSPANQLSSVSYQDNIKALNESVAAWIQKHINLNPYIDLTPIFNDYKEHMKSIDLKFLASPSVTEATSRPSPATESTSQSIVTPASSFSITPLTRQQKGSSDVVTKGKRVYNVGKTRQ